MDQHRKVRVDGKEAGYAEVIPPGGVDDPLFAAVAKLMDTAFRLPGTDIRFGLDPIIGLFPGFGDGAGALVSVALIGMSARHGVPKIVLVRMALNVILNAVLGAIPAVGDIFSVFYRSNVRNYELFRQHAGPRRASTWRDWLFVCAVLAVILAVVLGAMAFSWWLLTLLYRAVAGG